MTDPGLVTPPNIPPVDPAPHGRDRPVVRLAPLAFVALGMAEITLSVAWRPIADAFGREVGDIGFLLAAFATGYVVTALAQHRVSRSLATATLVIASSALGVIGATLYVAADAFALLAVGSLCFGMAAALIDTTLGSYIAVRHGARALNLMGAGFGVGALVGPGLLTLVLAHGGSWRLTYGVLLLLEAGLVAAWWVLRHRFDPLPVPTAGNRVSPPSRPVRRLTRVSIATFGLYVGTEQAFGVWAFWLLTSRGLDDNGARVLLTIYWAAITVGRFVVAGLSRFLTPVRVVSAGTLVTLGAAIALWAGGAGAAAGALIVAGLGLSGVFPSLVALTPLRLGNEQTQAVMGPQMAAAAIGGAVVPATIGVLQQRLGAGVIGPALVASAMSLVVLHRVALALDRGRDSTADALR